MIKPASLELLLRPFAPLQLGELASLQIDALELDSRKVKSGVTFVAIKGHSCDAREFINAAIDKGANLVLAQADEQYPPGIITRQGVAIIYLAGLEQRLSELAGMIYRHDNTRLIGVTGTNGKTTITRIIAQWLALSGATAAVMGTTGNGFLPELQPAANTTGSAIDIQRTLAEFNEQHAAYAALEVSSHGLVQGRVRALSFAVGVFTNLSRDHLDYHGTMQAYEQAKRSLFTEHDCQRAIINVDDPVGARWIKDLPQAVAVSMHGPLKGGAALWATHIAYSEHGIDIEFDGQWGPGAFHTPLIGEFNASNVLLALASLLSLGIDKSVLLATAENLVPVIGRMELFNNHRQAKVVVDYAHTPDALQKALSAIRVHCKGQIWAIFGCGGDRDRGKRPMMADIGECYADKVILTNDNPRSEAPEAIIADMQAGLKQPLKVIVEQDRFQALQYALENAGSEDFILLAGKGHEDYQILGQERIHYSDRESAAQLLGITL